MRNATRPGPRPAARPHRPSPCAAIGVSLLGLMLDPGPALAGPADRFEADFRACTEIAQRSPGGFECPICGVGSSCEGDVCSWGAIRFGRSTAEVIDGMDRGFPIYCARAGGVAIGGGAIAATQARALGGAFDAAEGRGGGYGAGAAVELARSEYSNPAAADPSTSTIYGGRVPLSAGFALGPRSSLEISAQVLGARGDALSQAGLAAAPTLVFALGPIESRTRVVLGAGLPFHLVHTSGGAGTDRLSWSVGVSGLAGLSHRIGPVTVGGGAVIDLRWIEGLLVPVQLVGRAALDLPGPDLRFVVQPGVATELSDPSRALDAVELEILAGVELGRWVLGYQGLVTADSQSHGIGLSFTRWGGAGPEADDALLADASAPARDEAGTPPTEDGAVTTDASTGDEDEDEDDEDDEAFSLELDDETSEGAAGEAPAVPAGEALRITVAPPSRSAPEPARRAPPTPTIRVDAAPPPAPVPTARQAPAERPTAAGVSGREAAPTPRAPPAAAPRRATPAPRAGGLQIIEIPDDAAPPRPRSRAPASAAPVASPTSPPTSAVAPAAPATPKKTPPRRPDPDEVFVRAVKAARRGQSVLAEALMWEAIVADAKRAQHVLNLARISKLIGRPDRAAEALSIGRSRFAGDPRFAVTVEALQAVPARLAERLTEDTGAPEVPPLPPDDGREEEASEP